jgi:hypothetical protein
MWISKRLVPAVIVVGLSIWFVSSFFEDPARVNDALFPLKLAAFLVLWGGLYFIRWRKGTNPLADEVLDTGDSLLVSRGGQRLEVPLRDIANVNWSPQSNPSVVTLALRRAGPLGESISFAPRRPNLFSSAEPMLLDLVRRIDAQRRA